MKTSNFNNSERDNKAVMENVSEMSNDELLAIVANELENGGKQDEPGARFKIGDRVRMKHDGATGTIARVWDGYDGFSYEVTRDVPIEGLEPGSEVWEAFPQESGLEPLEPASEITDVPAADLVWDEDEQGVKVWGNMEQHAENLTKMGAKRGRVVFKSNKTGLPTGADCWVLPKCKGEDVRQYVRKVHERISRDFSEAREKYGDKGHKYHEGEKVVTIYGRGTVVRGRACYASDLIDVQLDLPTYNYIWSLLGTPQKMVAVNRNDIVSIELPEPPAEVIIDVEPSLETSSEITDGAKKESFGKMFIYRLYIKWKWMQQRFERIGDMDRAADCFYHRLRLTKLYIYQPGWRIVDYGDMKPIFFPRQRIK